MGNEKIQKRLAKRDLRGLSVDDPFDRQQLIGELSKQRGIKRADAKAGVDTFARRYNGRDSVLRTEEQRRELATYVSRKAPVDKDRTPVMHGLKRAYDRMYTRRLPAQLSKGGGVRKFGKRPYYRVADSGNHASADIVANNLRRMGHNSRVMPYYSKKKIVGWTVYSENPIYAIKSNRQLRYLLSAKSPLSPRGKTLLADYEKKNRIVRTPKTLSNMGMINRVALTTAGSGQVGFSRHARMLNEYA